MLGGRKPTKPKAKAAARGASKRDAVRGAIEASEPVADIATGRPLVDMLCADDTLSASAVARIRAFGERTLSPSDLAGLLAFRVEKLRSLVESGDLTAERELTGWDKLGVFATSVVQLQAAQASAGGAQISITWGGFAPPPPPVGRGARKTDARIGDIIDTE